MIIIQRLLNKSVSIRRIVETVTDSGDILNKVQHISDVVVRIVRNKPDTLTPVTEKGVVVTSTHKMFTNVGLNILDGDLIYDGNDIYSIVYVDTQPAGVVDSHYEIYMNAVDSVNAIPVEVIS